jgi:hypothetical protein
MWGDDVAVRWYNGSDRMQATIATGQPYQTWLNPAPGPSTDANGTFIPMAHWDRTNWPQRIHPPKEGA